MRKASCCVPQVPRSININVADSIAFSSFLGNQIQIQSTKHKTNFSNALKVEYFCANEDISTSLEVSSEKETNIHTAISYFQYQYLSSKIIYEFHPTLVLNEITAH